MEQGLWGHRGGPWEFNLRDLFRWCQLLLADQQVGYPKVITRSGEVIVLIAHYLFSIIYRL